MLLKIKLAIASALGFLALLAGAYFKGRKAEAARLERAEMKRRLASIKKAKEKRDEVNSLDDTELSDRFRERVLRSKDDG